MAFMRMKGLCHSWLNSATTLMRAFSSRRSHMHFAMTRMRTLSSRRSHTRPATALMRTLSSQHTHSLRNDVHARVQLTTLTHSAMTLMRTLGSHPNSAISHMPTSRASQPCQCTCAAPAHLIKPGSALQPPQAGAQDCPPARHPSCTQCAICPLSGTPGSYGW